MTRGRLRNALMWDYLFILIYPLAISAACLIAGRYLDRLNVIAFRVTLLVILLQAVAALCDVMENYALLS